MSPKRGSAQCLCNESSANNRTESTLYQLNETNLGGEFATFAIFFFTFFFALLSPFSLPSPSHTASALNFGTTPLRLGTVSSNAQHNMGLERRVIWEHGMAGGLESIVPKSTVLKFFLHIYRIESSDTYMSIKYN